MKVMLKADGAHTPQECLESWSLIYDCTLKVRGVWPSIWTVPLAEGPVELVCACGKSPGDLLDVGAANCSAIKVGLVESESALRYFSFDIDRRTKQDFYSWEEMKQSFDVMACFEVIEHLDLATGNQLCGKVRERLKPGGFFVIGTPNVFNPVRYMQDPTHITPWCYDRLAGALLALGFNVCAIHRQRDFPQPARWRTRLLRSVTMKLRPHLGLDSSNSIYVIARRPEAEVKRP